MSQRVIFFLRPVVHEHAFQPGVVAVLDVLDELAVGPGVEHARAGQQHGAVQAQADGLRR